jgi:hypothetical protein
MEIFTMKNRGVSLYSLANGMEMILLVKCVSNYVPAGFDAVGNRKTPVGFN